MVGVIIVRTNGDERTWISGIAIKCRTLICRNSIFKNSLIFSLSFQCSFSRSTIYIVHHFSSIQNSRAQTVVFVPEILPTFVNREIASPNPSEEGECRTFMKGGGVHYVTRDVSEMK